LPEQRPAINLALEIATDARAAAREKLLACAPANEAVKEIWRQPIYHDAL
jgi:hypothetical protein